MRVQLSPIPGPCVGMCRDHQARAVLISPITNIAAARYLRHNGRARKTVRAGFDSPEIDRRTAAALARFFYVRMPLRTFYGRALAGVPSGTPVSYRAGLSTPPCARPPRLTAGSGFNDSIGGPHMAALPIPARSAQTYPQTEKAARRAARLWFTGTPTRTLAEWRDDRRQAHCARLPFELEREAAFNLAFERELAQIIGGAFHG